MRMKMKRVISFVTALVMILTMMPHVVPHVHAAGSLNTVPGLTATWTDASNSKGKANWTASGTTITGTATGFTQYVVVSSTVTTKLTLTNTLGSEAKLTFSYTLSGGGSVSGISGNSYEGTLANGASLIITLTSPKGSSTNTLEITGISLTSTATGTVTNTFKPAANGSYTVDGNTITGDTTIEKGAADTYAVEATPAGGYKLFGWYNETTGIYLSTAANTTLTLPQASTVYPVFIPEDIALFGVGTEQFFDLTEAANAASAGSSKTIILLNNGTLPAGNYTIPSGVTLLIPYDSANTLKTTNPNVLETYSKPSIYRTLTMASGAQITVNGAISVGGSQCAEMKDGYNGCVAGPAGRIHMESGSTITVNSGASLYAWGYITGSGSVTAESGAKVYESFQVTDYRGGDVTSSVATDKTHAVFPMSQYYLQNIEVPLTLKAGAIEKAAMSVTVTLLGVQTSDVTIIGTEGAMFTLNSGSIVKDFNESTGRTEFTIKGNVSVSTITMSMRLTGLSSTTIDTANFNLPIPGHMTVTAESGNITMAQDICLLPGSELIVKNGATCTIAKDVRVIAYSWTDWTSQKGVTNTSAQAYFVHASKHYKKLWYSPTTGGTVNTQGLEKDAQICVDGTIYAAEGAVYTTVNGANIYSTGTGKVVTTPGTETSTYQLFQTGSDSKTKDFVRIGIKPAELKNSDGTMLNTGLGGTNAYKYENGKWVCDPDNEICAGHHTRAEGVPCGKDLTCAVCGETFDLNHQDDNKDHACDNGCDVYQGEHTDGEDANHLCDYGCGQIADAGCYDADNDGDHKCDECGTENVTACSDAANDGDHDCDECGAENVTACSDAANDGDHKCDDCGAADVTVCSDAANDGDHKCDDCGAENVTACSDAANDGDHKCDDCSAEDVTACGDSEPKNHICDTDSACTVYNTGDNAHADKNTDHICDYDCSESIGEHADGSDADHVCDYCQGSVGENCYDADNDGDHKCDECGTENVTACGDEGKDHICDTDSACNVYSTGDNAHEDSDADTDHLCAYCGEAAEGCHDADNDGDHTCDECGAADVTVCGDAGKDHICDTDSACTVYSTGDNAHDDKNTDHACDYGCSVTIGDHADGDDANHLCDYGCGKVADDGCYDAADDGDHICDECHAEKVSACGDAGKDHTCDTDSACTVYSTGDNAHDDKNTDHACDYGCSVTIGDHADGDDANHLCDYGCGKVADDGCYDAADDGDHNCDECGAENVTTCGDSGKDHICDTDSVCAVYNTGKNAHADSPADKDHVCDYGCGAVLESCTESEPVIENKVEPDCENDGSYDNVVYCSVCNAELSRDTTVIPATGHTEAEAVVENNVDPTCTADGSYDTVVYCSICEAELSRETTVVPAKGHTNGEVVVENEVAPDCENTGSYDNVIYCTVCQVEVSRENVTVPALGHKYEAVETAPTCTEKGYTTHTCSVCDDSYVDSYVDALGHTAGEPVVENEKAATCTVDGSYDTVVYCSVCNAELSRETITVPTVAHTAGEAVKENEVAATCTTEGSYDNVVYCTVCDAELSRETITVPTVAHTEGAVVVENEVAATCTTKGSYDNVVYCTVCKTEVSRVTVTIDALGHTEGEVVVENEVAPDCVKEGSYDNVVYCTVCGNELSRETVTVDALGHKYNAVVTAPTCTAEGYTTYTCSVCGDSYVADEVAALGHKYEFVVTAPTCTEKGYTTHVCSACGDTYVDSDVDALGHTAGETVVEKEVAATCTTDGSYDTVVYCSVCDAELSRETTVVPAAGHTEGAAVVENNVAPTCTADGSYDTVVYCSVCEAELSRETTVVPAAGHTEGAAVVENNVAPTCTADGSYDTVVYCSVCDAELSRETVKVDALGHTKGEAVVENEKAATCTADGGYDTVVYCTVCNAEMSRVNTVVSATGHTAGEPVVENEKAATCTVDGSYDTVVYCSVCDAELSRETVAVDPLGHKYNAVETAPTCTAEGYTTYTCSVCGDSYVADEVAALGHKYEFVVTAPTCTEKGYTTHTCSVCGDSYVDSYVDAKGHTAGKTVVEKEVAADCENAGSYDNVIYCSVCGEELSRDTVVVDALGHKYESVVTAPTCTEGGYTTHTCSVCGDSYVDSYVDAKGHTEGEAVVENNVDPTCTVDGSYDTVVYCTICKEEVSRETIVVPATGHTEAEAVVENNVDPTCTADGSYDTVVYCSVCDAELSRVNTVVPATGHTAGETVVENEVAATCTEDGSYDNVAYCTVCGEEASRETIVIPATGHTAGEAVKENEVAPTCTADGSYDNVVYCSVCNAELSRVTTTVPATGHTEGEAVVEKEVAATCTTDGSYDTVVYCSICNAELSRETITVPTVAHTEGAVVVENEVAATCTTEGSYDNVVYCSVCNAELSRVTTTVPATGHTEGEAVVEKEVAATCTTDGSYDTVVYCSICNAELSRETIVVPATGHTEAEAVVENNVDPTCTADGSYDTVVYCSVCNAELSRVTTTVPATGHTEAEAVVENNVDPTCTADGSYDTVVYCSVCDAELSREKITVSALGHKHVAVVTDPTCTEGGYTTHICSVCGDSYVDSYVDATGHKYVNGECVCGAIEVQVVVVDEDAGISCTVDGDTVTVKYDMALRVGYWDAESDTYIAITAVENEDGTYSFTAPEGVKEVLIVITGDTNGDGKITAPDIARLNAHLKKKVALTAEELFAMDVNYDGEVTDADRDVMTKAILGMNPYDWEVTMDEE